jgi:hypothetical protein
MNEVPDLFSRNVLDGTLDKIVSALFAVTLSSLPRGAFCGDGDVIARVHISDFQNSCGAFYHARPRRARIQRRSLAPA